MKRHLVLVLFAMLLAVSIGGEDCRAQSDRAEDVAERPERREDRRLQPDDDLDPGRMQEVLERRLEQIREQEQVLEAAIRGLESGESPEDVRRRMFEQMRDRDRFDGDGPLREEGGPPWRGGRESEDGRPPLVLDEETRRQALAFLREFRPELYERLEALRETRHEEFVSMLDRYYPRLRRLMEERSKDPERFEIEMNIRTIEDRIRERLRAHVEKFGNVPNEELAAALRTDIDAVFDLRIQLRKRDLERFSERLDHLAASIERESSQKSEFVDQQVNALIEQLEEGRLPDEASDRSTGRRRFGGSEGRRGDRGRPDDLP